MSPRDAQSNARSALLRQLPAVDELLRRPRLAEVAQRVSRALLVETARTVLDELRRHDVRLVTLADGISFDGPYGSLMYALVAGLAELEREAIRERVRAGLRAAKARGVRRRK